MYMVSLSHQERCLRWHIRFIHNFNGGRLEGLVPSKGKPIQFVSRYVLQNVLAFIPVHEGFFTFRRVCKKFNESLIDFVDNRANYLQSKISEYTEAQQKEAYEYFNK